EDWFTSAVGEPTVTMESHLLGAVLPDLFGYHIVQLGCHHGAALIDSSRISHQLLVELGGREGAAAGLLCEEDALPLAANTVDVLVLPHVLEFADDPRRVLREAERVLIGEGHIVILAFNPWSLFGVTALCRRWQGRPPWTGHVITAARIKDWLQLLGFDIVTQQRAGFRPPWRRAAASARLAFLEKFGAFCWPVLGNVVMIVGKKRVEGVTPLKASWRQRRSVLAGSVAEPSARQPGGLERGRHD
ncbi:MAG: class I SAM-dependent methyltransferase, partial [Gammaproteobacteria bacterium]